MTGCTTTPVTDRVQQHPCSASAEDRNWDAVKSSIRQINANIAALTECFNTPITESVGVRRFRIIAELNLRNKARAVLLTRNTTTKLWEVELDEAEEPVEISVKDANQLIGFWQGTAGWEPLTGYEGWAIPSVGEQDDGFDTWIIVWMEHIAKKISYTVLEENFEDSYFLVELNDFSDGMSPLKFLNPNAIDADEDPLTEDPGWDYIKVYDPLGIYSYWHDYGCRGQAEWNTRLKRYEITTAQLLCKTFQGTLVYPICVGEEETEPAPPPGDEPFQVEPGTWYLQGYHSAIPYEYQNVSEDPEVEEWMWAPKPLFEIENYCDHRGNAGDKVVVQGYLHIKDPEDEEDTTRIIWNVEDMAKKQYGFVKGFEWDSEYCALSAVYHRVQVEACNYEYEDSVGIPFAVRELPVEFDSVYFHDPENPANDICRTIAYTEKFCIVEREEAGEDLLVQDYSRVEAMEWWGFDHLPEAIGVNEEERWIEYNTNMIFVPCFYDGDTVKRPLRRQDVIYEFDHKDSEDPEECLIEAKTKEWWMLDVFFPADPPEGELIDVITFDARTVVVDVYMSEDGTQLRKDLETHYVPCYRELDDELIEEVEECPEEEPA
jgi:hypothetical protein